jgi:methionyl-tRNA synthetase
VAYVWFDALINYCTAVGYPDDRERFDRYWPANYHLIGKDILRQHAVYWPAMLMAAGEALPETIFAHGFLLVGGEKMSKTRMNQIAPADLVAEFGVDGFRYHFVADQRFGPDGDFSYEAMVARYNSDLANNFGNLASRVLNMATNYVGGTTPATREDGPLVQSATAAFEGLRDGLAQLDFSGGFAAVWQLIKDTNAYIEDRQPWALHKSGDAEATTAVLGDCLEALRIVALLASPVIPHAAAELWRRLGLPGAPEDQRVPEVATWGSAATAGNVLEKGTSLFPRIDRPD